MSEASRKSDKIGVVLAAGKGTRMRSSLPKVLHPVAGRPMLLWVLDALVAAGCDRSVVIVGHGGEAVREACAGYDVDWVEQREQLGTGHALAQAESSVPADALMLVVSGDVPMVSAATLASLAEVAGEGWGAMAVARLEEPRSLGRVLVRKGDPEARGELERIVEASDASPKELAVKLVNAGLYALPASGTFARLAQVGRDNAKGEIYLTDALGLAATAGERIGLVELADAAEAWGINDRIELARVHREILHRHLDALAGDGVTVLDPARTVIEPGIAVGQDVVVHPDVNLTGTTSVGAGTVLHQGVWARDAEIGEDCVVEAYTVLDGVVIEAGAKVGPFARLRPGAKIGAGARVGNFVEVKNSTLGAGAKAGHLAYLGDAQIGEGANIGAGTITCNYDGESKHPTEIGSGAFIGSDTMLVAPVKVGEGATTAAGSVIAKDVPAGALAVERTQQRNIEGWAERRRRKRDKS
jgi:bifunctional UDP-N-acetylglucosamine pyrophosphorylase/glucosamine-1-phosphate N-acetyltransferase